MKKTYCALLSHPSRLSQASDEPEGLRKFWGGMEMKMPAIWHILVEPKYFCTPARLSLIKNKLGRQKYVSTFLVDTRTSQADVIQSIHSCATLELQLYPPGVTLTPYLFCPPRTAKILGAVVCANSATDKINKPHEVGSTKEYRSKAQNAGENSNPSIFYN